MYRISISRLCDGISTEVIFPISDCEKAYNAFYKACELCELTGGNVVLYDANTCEILNDNSGES